MRMAVGSRLAAGIDARIYQRSNGFPSPASNERQRAEAENGRARPGVG